jgi:CspA family cold shock protein
MKQKVLVLLHQMVVVQDVFVHSTGLIDEIRENDKVEFEVENGRKGLNAVNVKVV